MTPSRLRFPLLGLGIFSLLAALWAALVRLGWQLPPLVPTLPAAHGPLMVSGFLGTIIGLERAVALTGMGGGLSITRGQGGRSTFLFVGPALTALGAVALIVGLPAPVGRGLLTLGSLGLVVIFGIIVCRHLAFYTVTMSLGAVCWLIGNGLWLAGRPIYQAVLWWAGFLVLTSVGERLELSRVLKLTRRTQLMFVICAGLFLAGLIASIFLPALGARVTGAGMIALAAWLLLNDIARKTIRQRGLPRFIAAGLLAGYVWLAVGGAFALAFGGVVAGLHYDALLHAVFLGFVMSMIFAHAPIIFPAVLGIPVVYRSRFYGHLALLHISLVLRIAGDLAVSPTLRLWGGMFNVIAVLMFLGSTLSSLLAGRRVTGDG